MSPCQSGTEENTPKEKALSNETCKGPIRLNQNFSTFPQIPSNEGSTPSFFGVDMQSFILLESEVDIGASGIVHIIYVTTTPRWKPSTLQDDAFQSKKLRLKGSPFIPNSDPNWRLLHYSRYRFSVKFKVRTLFGYFIELVLYL